MKNSGCSLMNENSNYTNHDVKANFVWKKLTENCLHAKSMNNKFFILVLEALMQNIVFTKEINEKIKNDFLICWRCKERNIEKLYACVHCTYVGCHTNNSHLNCHFEDNKHFIYMNLADGTLLCHICEKNKKIKKYVLEYGTKMYTPLSDTCGKKIEECFSRKRVHSYGSKPVGIVNRGNTCFINSILQILLHTPIIMTYLLSGIDICPDENESCTLCELKIIAQSIFDIQKKHNIDTKRFLDTIFGYRDSTYGYNQEDAHEYFNHILQKLHLKDAKTRAKKLEHCLITNENLSEKLVKNCNENSTEKVEVVGCIKECDCFVEKAFGGIMKSLLVCVKCKNTSESLETFYDISLSVTNILTEKGKKLSLKDCLEEHTKVEYLGSDTKLYCSHCNSLQEKKKQYLIGKLPNVLCLHLKKFCHYNLSEKLNVDMIIPECIDMTEYLHKNEHTEIDKNKNLFKLYGVISHSGTIDSGHYVSYVKCGENWYLCDDAEVTLTTLQNVLKCDVYILFYKKIYIPNEDII